jgi:uncharacterized protein YoxC
MKVIVSISFLILIVILYKKLDIIDEFLDLLTWTDDI